MHNQFLTKSKITNTPNKFKSKLFGVLVISTFILNIKACDKEKLAPGAVSAPKAFRPFARERTSTIRGEEDLELSDKASGFVSGDMPVATSSTSLPARFAGFDFRGLSKIGSECAESVINAELSAENAKLLKANVQLKETNSELARACSAHMAKNSELVRIIAALEAEKMRLSMGSLKI